MMSSDARAKISAIANEALHFVIGDKEQSINKLRLPFKCHTYWKNDDGKTDEDKEHIIDDHDGKVLLNFASHMVHMSTDLIPRENDPNQIIYSWTKPHEIINTFRPFYYNDFVWSQDITNAENTIFPSPMTMSCSIIIPGIKEPVPVVVSFLKQLSPGSIIFGGPLLNECEMGMQSLQDSQNQFLLWYKDPRKNWLKKVESEYKKLQIDDETLVKYWPWGTLFLEDAKTRKYSINEMMLAAEVMETLLKNKAAKIPQFPKKQPLETRKVTIADYKAALGKDETIVSMSRLHKRLIQQKIASNSIPSQQGD